MAMTSNEDSTLTVVLSEHLNTLKQPFARCTLTSDRSMADRTATLSMHTSRSRQRGRTTTPHVGSLGDHEGAAAAAADRDGNVGGGEMRPRLATTSPTV